MANRRNFAEREQDALKQYSATAERLSYNTGKVVAVFATTTFSVEIRLSNEIFIRYKIYFCSAGAAPSAEAPPSEASASVSVPSTAARVEVIVMTSLDLF